VQFQHCQLGESDVSFDEAFCGRASGADEKSVDLESVAHHRRFV
jgi:hypothetical protein